MKKKSLLHLLKMQLLFLCLTLPLPLLAIDVNVADENGNVLTYSYDTDDGPATFTGIKSYAEDAEKAGHIVIADAVNDENGISHVVKYVAGGVRNRSGVVSIVFGKNIIATGGPEGTSRDAFSGCQKLTSVTLNAGLQILGEYTFLNCYSMENINLGDCTSLTAIMANALEDCDQVRQLTVPASVTTIGYEGLYSIDSLRTITLAAGSQLTSLCSCAFQNNMSLESINIEACTKLTAFPDSWLNGCPSVKSLTVPASVETFGRWMFNGSNNIETITFLAPSVPEDFYRDRGKLTTVNIGPGVKSIGKGAFYGDVALTNLNIDPTVSDLAIGNNAFYNAEALETISLPAGITSIGESAFRSIDSLRTVTFSIGSQLATMGAGAFRDNAKLESINIEVCTQLTAWPDSWLYSCPSLKSLTVPAQMETFGRWMFDYSNNIETITFLAPTVPENFYRDRAGLTTVNIGAGVKTIGNNAFYNSDKLTTINFNSAVSGLAIGNYAFAESDIIEAVNLPVGVTSIGESAFRSMDSLRTVTFADGSQLTTMYTGAFRDNHSLERINIEACTQLTVFPDSWLNNCPLIKEITVPVAVETFGRWMFDYTNNIETITVLSATLPENFYRDRVSLTTINIGARVKNIGNAAFYNSDGLKQVNIDPAVSDLAFGEYVFSECDSLPAFHVPAGVVSMGYRCFRLDKQLKTFTFDPASQLTEIPSECFAHLESLETITLPDAVQTVGYDQFWGCNILREVTFGTGLTTLPDNWNFFAYCSKLEKITLPGVTYPFTSSIWMPETVLVYVHPDMVETYKTSNPTSGYHIIAIGQPYEFAVTTTAGGQLQEKVEAIGDPGNVLSLTVSGPIDGTDINYIHGMMPNLSVLNLWDSRIVEGGDSYYQWNVNSGGVATIEGYYGPWNTENDVVGYAMFYNMPMLTSLSLPKGTKSIGDYAIAQDRHTYLRLSHVDIPDGVTQIGRYAFYYTGITDVTVPAGITRLEEYTFWHCEKLKKAVLPDGITFIGHSAFSECYELEDVNIPTSVETIDQYAFYNNQKRNTPIVLPAGLKTIGAYAFRNNYVVPSITFNDGLETIDYEAFRDCYTIEQAVLPESITYLGESAFYNCDSLRTFTFPQNIKEVPNWILQYCDALTSVTLAEGTTRIGEAAFADCPRLSSINIMPETPLTFVGNYAFDDTAIPTMTLPNSITEMGYFTFQGCDSLESVNLPTGIDYVPYGYCQNCEKLKSVKMHDGIRTIYHEAFENCTSLTDIELNDEITRIEYDAFWGTKVPLTELPDSLKFIGGSAFRGMNTLSTLTIPAGVTTIEGAAFAESSLTAVELPEGLTNLGTYVFYRCDTLSNVKLPKNLTRIPDYTFQYCKNLQYIDLPDGLKEIGYAAFDWSGLKEIEVSDSVSMIERYAFSNTQLETFRVPDGLTTSPGAYFLAGCKHLKKVYMGRNEDYNEYSDFTCLHNCDSLQLLRLYFGTPPKCNTYYMGYRTNCVLEVSEDLVDVYKEANGWKDFKEIRGFFMGDVLNDLDYAVLCKLYRENDGQNWKSVTWNMENDHHATGKWPGVTTTKIGNELFAITDINLKDQGLTGQLPDSLFLLKYLKTLNLEGNQLTGNVGTMRVRDGSAITELYLRGNRLTGDLYPLASKMPELTALDMGYNQLTAISQPIPKDKLTADYRKLIIGMQFVDWKTKDVVDDLPEDAPFTDITPGVPAEIEFNSVFTYRHDRQDFGHKPTSMEYIYWGNGDWRTSWQLNTDEDGLWMPYRDDSNYVLAVPKNKVVIFRNTYPYWDYHNVLLRFNWEDGDVNADQTVDVTDLQSVVYYALNDRKPGGQMFNYTCADANSDSKINVSDIVGSVDYVLAYQQPAEARFAGTTGATGTTGTTGANNLFTVGGNSVVMANGDAVAALQFTVYGASSRQLRVSEALRGNFSVSMRDVEGGVRIVAYSASGATLAPGEHELLTSLPAGSTVTDVRLADAEARHLGVTIVGDATAVESIAMPSQYTGQVYDLSGRSVGSWETLPQGIYIIRVNGKQYKVKK